MALEIRPARPDEFGAFLSTLEFAAGRHPSQRPEEPSYEADRTLAAIEDGSIIGGTASEPTTLTVPGLYEVPAAKITLTGVLPGHRGRGIASEFMRRQLRDLTEPLAVLTTSQSNVPGRHGFASATRSVAADLTPRVTVATPRLRLRLLDLIEARRVLPGMYDRHRREQVGQVARSSAFWEGWFRDDPLLRIGDSPRFVVVTDDGAGYLTYRLDYGPLRERPVRRMVVEDLIATTTTAQRELWAYCIGFEQAPLVHAWNLAPDAPVFWMADGVGIITVTEARPFLRLRLVDAAAALAARAYAVPDRLVLDIADDVVPKNSGRFLLDGGPDGAVCAATKPPADLHLSAGDLAAVYLGGTAVSALARAGRVIEHTPGAIRRADLMFSWFGAPWTVTDW